MNPFCQTIDYQHQVRPPNFFDQCLMDEAESWRRIALAGGISQVAERKDGRYWKDDPWVVMPREGLRFHKIGPLALPVDDGLDYRVMSFPIPMGYEATIKLLTCNFIPRPGQLGLAEGSGDITWRLRVNNWWVRDYAVTTTSLGDMANPHVLSGGGIRVRPAGLIQYWVNVAFGAAARLDPLGRIVCVIGGWFYPAM